MTPRRSTTSISLVLIGSAALHGCGEEVGKRDIYRSQAECAQDWGSDPTRCERQRSGSHTGYYYGPYYSSSEARRQAVGTTALPRQGSSAVGSTSVVKSTATSSSSSVSSSSSARSSSSPSSSSSVSRSGFGASSTTHASSSSS